MTCKELKEKSIEFLEYHKIESKFSNIIDNNFEELKEMLSEFGFYLYTGLKD